MKIFNRKSSKLNKGVSLLLALAIFIVAISIDLPDGSSLASAANNQIQYPYVMMDGHVQDLGWNWFSYYTYHISAGNFDVTSSMTGTTGRSLRLEAIQLYVNTGNYKLDGKIHVTTKGGERTYSNREARLNSWTYMSGTTGRSIPLHQISIWLSGDIANKYNIVYRVHVQDEGWKGYVKNGSPAHGSRNQRIEALEVFLEKK